MAACLPSGEKSAEIGSSSMRRSCSTVPSIVSTMAMPGALVKAIVVRLSGLA